MATISHITNTNELRSAANSLTQLKTEFTVTLKGMDAIVQSVDNYWDGPASEAFKAEYNKLKGYFGKYEADLTLYKTFLDEAAVEYERSDETVLKDTGSLATAASRL